MNKYLVLKVGFHASDPECGGHLKEARIVEAESESAAREIAEGGPAQVASAAYRAGWARIFGGEPEIGQA